MKQPDLPLSSMAEVTFALLLPAKKWNNTIDFVHQHLACYLSMSEFTTAIYQVEDHAHMICLLIPFNKVNKK